jgi:hypothetical protein
MQEAIYRMYYHAWQIPTGIGPGGPLTIGYFESSDGITWKRPKLGLCEFNGLRCAVENVPQERGRLICSTEACKHGSSESIGPVPVALSHSRRHSALLSPL